MSVQTYGWLVLAFPLGGAVLMSLLFRVLPGKVPGFIGTLAIALSFASAIGAFIQLQALDADARHVVSVGWDYAVTSGVDAKVSILIDPLSVMMMLIVSALIFCIGVGGVLTRRNPLVILLCLELMLNAANLALVAFSRNSGDMGGQIFALIVMVVAACEVAVGLGLIVALYRRRLPIDVDELRELQG